jgi:GNAT superfamily N-acetyltransferase
MNKENLTNDFVYNLELIEAKAWEDWYLSADRNTARKCGINIASDNTALILMVLFSDVLALNRILGAGINSQVTENDIRKYILIYTVAGSKRFFMQLNPLIDDPKIPDFLLKAGFEHYNNWVKLYRDVSPIENVKSDLRVEKIDQNYANDFARIVTTSFDWDDALRPWISSTVGRDNWYHYIAFDGDTPAATGAFYRYKDSAWVDFAATLEDYRGRGAQTVLMQKRVADIASLGCRHIVVETAQQTPQRSAPSHRNMLRLGFKEAYIRPNYLYKF